MDVEPKLDMGRFAAVRLPLSLAVMHELAFEARDNTRGALLVLPNNKAMPSAEYNQAGGLPKRGAMPQGV